ncbi:MAG: cyclohexa-1,5-dienecarbonyl-CoA hydratase [Rhodospirillales bacterium]|nr:cyclohexa-1,5-dienecarbonyl-CoA hydratase [Rhodospirillales bacterium]
MSGQPLKVWLEEEDTLLRLRLATPKGNIIDIAMVEAIEAALAEHTGRDDLMAVLLDHEGPHFGFGASIPEHLPGVVDELVSKLHRMIKAMLTCPVPILTIVKGQCLGGSLEVVIAGNLIFAGKDAVFGQPEVRLGTCAPVGSCILPERIPRAMAEDLLLSGRSVGADEALAMGLANRVDEDPEVVALNYFREHFAHLSATGLRFAIGIQRRAFVARVSEELDRAEETYLKGLMKTPDPVEGLKAFMEKRKPVWQNNK